MIKILKVKILDGILKKMAKEQGLDDEDLVLVTVEKIEGSPVQYLQDKFIKEMKEEMKHPFAGALL